VARIVEFEAVVDTSYFSAVQLQLRTVGALCWSALARWLKHHLVAFPRLIQGERCGLVVLGFHYEASEAVSFFDCESLLVRAGLRAMRRGARAELDVRFSNRGREIAAARLVLCPVAIEDPVSLAASPRPFDDRLLARFQDDERVSGSPSRVLPERRTELESRGPALAQRVTPFFVHRQLCEVAEQWSWIEVSGYAEAARERLALDQATAHPALQIALREPLRRFDVEFSRPFYSFERGEIVTRAYAAGGRLGLVHSLVSDGGAALHALVVEAF
jgi:hypothetical protein